MALGKFASLTYRSSQEDVHEILTVDGDHPLSQPFDWFIMTLIAVNMITVAVVTVDPIFDAYRDFFVYFEVVSVAIFTAEYLGRLWACIATDEFASPITGRIRHGTQPLLIIDLLAIIPFYLGAFFIDLRFLRVLRLYRFFRLFKLARYSDAMRGFGNVLREKREDLTLALSATAILLVISSSAMYFAERTAQPEVFSSIPAALWWGIVTLTTVGYGDVYPVTMVGRVLGAVIALLGVGLVALPASILASGFIQEDERTNGVCPHCGDYVDELGEPHGPFPPREN